MASLSGDRRLRIGGVPYGVGEALVRGLACNDDVELVRAVPRLLIASLRRGELDAALVSSIEGFRTQGYAAIADLGIACKRQARSVRAFLRPDVAITRVGLDDGSETSVALLRILLARHFGVSGCVFERIEPSVDVDAYPHDLVLLIGDCGLHAQTRRFADEARLVDNVRHRGHRDLRVLGNIFDRGHVQRRVRRMR